MRVMVTGHRPNKLGGFEVPNATERWVRDQLQGILLSFRDRRPDLVAVSGMALGADTIWVEEARLLDIPYLAAVPFRAFSSRWPQASQVRYQQLLGFASEVVYVDELPDYQAADVNRKLQMRNVWMVNNSNKTVAVWDGSGGGTRNTVRACWELPRAILRVDPLARTVALQTPPG